MHGIFDKDDVEGSEFAGGLKLVEAVVSLHQAVLLVILNVVVYAFEDLVEGCEFVVFYDFDTELAICGLHEKPTSFQTLLILEVLDVFRDEKFADGVVKTLNNFIFIDVVDFT